MRPSLLLAATLLPAAAHAAPPAAPEPPPGRPEAAVELLIVEDEGMRSEELRVRGEPQRVTVRTKGRVKTEYEIVVPHRGSTAGRTGQRVWNVLSF